MAKRQELSIRQPKWMRKYYAIIMVVAIIGLIAMYILYKNELLSLVVFIALDVLCGLCAVIGIGGLIIYSGKMLYYKGGAYYCKRPFKKIMCAPLKEIGYVKIKKVGNTFTYAEVIFYSKNNEELIKFSDDGWIFKGNVFLWHLKKNHIKVVIA